MYKNKTVLGIVPARGGSKGIPRKNIIDLCGKPLIAYTIEAGLNSKYIDCVMVSTDDAEIKEVALGYGAQVPFMRPPELATDKSKTIDAIVYTLDKLKELGEKYDVLVLLQPTQPLRTSDDIDDAINIFFDFGEIPLASVSEVDDNPVLIRTIDHNRLVPLLNTSSTIRRQDMPIYYRVNGCIYINKISDIDKQTSFNDNLIPFIMKKNHSVDIDDVSDVLVAKNYIENRK